MHRWVFRCVLSLYIFTSCSVFVFLFLFFFSRSSVRRGKWLVLPLATALSLQHSKSSNESLSPTVLNIVWWVAWETPQWSRFLPKGGHLKGTPYLYLFSVFIIYTERKMYLKYLIDKCANIKCIRKNVWDVLFTTQLTNDNVQQENKLSWDRGKT